MTGRALVTGGGGFLGFAIVKKLVAAGLEVTSLQRGDYPRLTKLGVASVRAELSDRAAVRAACRGMDVVFHVAAKAGVWGPAREYERTNVEGTLAVIGGCRAEGVPRLVYTSTPSVVHGGDNVSGVDESAPYATKFLAHYPRTKALAERSVLAANDPTLSTVALRPHLIWGPGDNQLVPRIVARHQAGKLKLVGSGDNLVDSIYVDNAADAHLLAAERLSPGAACAGKPYFITQGEPMKVRDLLNGILSAAGLGPVTQSVPPALAFAVGALLEGAFWLSGAKTEPIMTRFVARQLSTSHFYDLTASSRDLRFEPRLTVAQGLVELKAWFDAGAPSPDASP